MERRAQSKKKYFEKFSRLQIQLNSIADSDIKAMNE